MRRKFRTRRARRLCSQMLAWYGGVLLGGGVACLADLHRSTRALPAIATSVTASGGPFDALRSQAYVLEDDQKAFHAALDQLSARLPHGRPIIPTRMSPQLSFPLKDSTISSTFGARRDPFGKGRAFHHGIDFAATAGTPVLASADGVVVKARYQRDYGRTVEIDHGDGHTTLYAHNRNLLVRKGGRVRAGQQIATVGSTGRSTGPHLHFEVRVNGQRVDPLRLLAINDLRGESVSVTR